MGQSLCIQVLKPVPKQFFDDRVFDDAELTAADLTIYYNIDIRDDYHASLKMRSVYAELNDIKRHLENVLGITIQNWSISHSGKLYHCRGECLQAGHWEHDLSEDEVKALERPHVSDVTVCCVERSWFIDRIPSWIVKDCPMYVKPTDLAAFTKQYIASLDQQDVDELGLMIEQDDLYPERILESLCAVCAYAKKVGGIAYVSLE